MNLELCSSCSPLIKKTEWKVGVNALDFSSDVVEPTGEAHEGQVCSLCLGIGGKKMIESVVALAKERFVEKEYEIVPDFTVSVSLPPSLYLRKGILALIPEIDQMKKSTEDFVSILKKRLTDQVVQMFEKDLGMKYNPKSTDLSVNLVFCSKSADDMDAVFLQTYFPSKFVFNRKRRFDRNAGRGGKFRRLNVEARNEAGHGAGANGAEDEFSQKRKQMQEFADRFYCKFKKPVVYACLDGMDEVIARRYMFGNLTACDYKISLFREPLILGGRYCKYSRSLPHSRWGTGKDDTFDGKSVETYICEFLKTRVNARSFRFTSCGREDVDVRMLGNGRPFGVSLINFTKKLSPEELAVCEAEINKAADGNIEVKGLQMLDQRQFQFLKWGDLDRKKTYVATCISESKFIDTKKVKALTTMVPLELEQKTPVRVMHTRALMARKRIVTEMTAVGRILKSQFKIKLTTQAGTYIKEFVHGDFGRTQPCLADLLEAHDLDIIELDVEDIDIPWPPTEEAIKENEEKQKQRRVELRSMMKGGKGGASLDEPIPPSDDSDDKDDQDDD